MTDDKEICKVCNVKPGCIGVTNLDQPTRIEGNTIIHEPITMCMDCFKVMRFGKKC